MKRVEKPCAPVCRAGGSSQCKAPVGSSERDDAYSSSMGSRRTEWLMYSANGRSCTETRATASTPAITNAIVCLLRGSSRSWTLHRPCANTSARPRASIWGSPPRNATPHSTANRSRSLIRPPSSTLSQARKSHGSQATVCRLLMKFPSDTKKPPSMNTDPPITAAVQLCPHRLRRRASPAPASG